MRNPNDLQTRAYCTAMLLRKMTLEPEFMEQVMTLNGVRPRNIPMIVAPIVLNPLHELSDAIRRLSTLSVHERARMVAHMSEAGQDLVFLAQIPETDAQQAWRSFQDPMTIIEKLFLDARAMLTLHQKLGTCQTEPVKLTDRFNVVWPVEPLVEPIELVNAVQEFFGDTRSFDEIREILMRNMAQEKIVSSCGTSSNTQSGPSSLLSDEAGSSVVETPGPLDMSGITGTNRASIGTLLGALWPKSAIDMPSNNPHRIGLASRSPVRSTPTPSSVGSAVGARNPSPPPTFSPQRIPSPSPGGISPRSLSPPPRQARYNTQSRQPRRRSPFSPSRTRRNRNRSPARATLRNAPANFLGASGPGSPSPLLSINEKRIKDLRNEHEKWLAMKHCIYIAMKGTPSLQPGTQEFMVKLDEGKIRCYESRVSHDPVLNKILPHLHTMLFNPELDREAIPQIKSLRSPDARHMFSAWNWTENGVSTSDSHSIWMEWRENNDERFFEWKERTMMVNMEQVEQMEMGLITGMPGNIMRETSTADN